MTTSKPAPIDKVGIIGVGVMGSMIALLFADNGIDVSIYDRSEASLRTAAAKADEAGLGHKITICKDYESLCQSLGPQKVFMFSLPHGSPGDSVVKTLQPYLRKGDIVIDGSNENYLVTQKRQATLQSRGVAYVGMGVSGGFSGARHGPSLMPSGEEWALDRLIPLLKKIAAKDDQGRPCVTKIGTGGSGHYVKMIHNGIEHGVMSVLCEAWELMHQCLQMDGDEIGPVFDSWNREGVLKNNFLVSISGPICRTRDRDGSGYLLRSIQDAVVQDANNSEGTGVWANLEAMSSHIPAPSLTAAHYLRLASANITQRQSIRETMNTASPTPLSLSPEQKSHFLSDLHSAVYISILACFIQGLDLLAHTSAYQGWDVPIASVLQIWRAGCIIKSDYITSLLETHYSQFDPRTDVPPPHPLTSLRVAAEVTRCHPTLKRIVLQGLSADAHLPTIGATLEYLKYVGCTALPTCFMEAQLDAFGAHGYELKGEAYGGGARQGTHHSAWSM